MRIFGLAFVLLGAFLSFARAQTPPTDPTDDLLRAVKALANSGRVDDPATVKALLHISFSETVHSVSGGSGRGGCPAGGRQVNDSFDMPHNIPEVRYNIGGELGCDQANQNEVAAYVDVDRIDDTCIGTAEIAAIFPKFGPGDYVPDAGWMSGGWQGDFAYSVGDTKVNFLMTEAPPEVPTYMRGPPGFRPPSDLIASHHPPVCLVAMSLSSRFQFGPSHKLDFGYSPPTSTRTGMISPPTSYQTPPTDPGIFLLRVVKAVADSGRSDDPDIVANALHTPLTTDGYMNDTATSCAATPDFRNLVNISYSMTTNSWFRALPTGKRVLKSGMQVIFGPWSPATIPIDDPVFTDTIFGSVTCTSSPTDLVGTWITFKNIPPYACITESQIKSIFPDVHPLPPGDAWDDVADQRYSSVISTTDGQMFADAIVDFGMTSSLPGGIQPHQPVCLDEVDIHGLYHLTGIHKLDLGNSRGSYP